MRTVKWNAFLSGLCVFAVALGVVAASARADVTIEKGSSILIFPKVRADGTFDTTIQISNIGNSMVHARCFYVNATLVSAIPGAACTAPSATCTPEWQETDFNIWLTEQQPTHWLVSTGRTALPGFPGNTDNAGFSPGRVPPMGGSADPFIGELKCVEVDDSDAPLTGNHLKGEATIDSLINSTNFPPGPTKSGDVAKYNAVGIQGNPNNPPGSNTLPLDGGTTYNACPAKLIVDFFAGGVGADDLVATQDLRLATGTVTSNSELTLVPCSEDFETQTPTMSTVQFVVYNEFETKFSASVTVDCYLNEFLTLIDSPEQFPPSNATNSIFSETVLGTDVGVAEITPVPDNNGNSHAVVGVLERVTSSREETAARSIYNLHTQGDLIPATGPETIILSGP